MSRPERLPSVSVVIPTYRRPQELTACLEAVAGLDYPGPRLQAIVVDDGGREPLDAVLAPFRSRLELALVRAPHRGPAGARNAGIERSEGEAVAFLDDDCAPAADWLRRLAERLTRDAECAAGGRRVNALAGNRCSKASQLVTDVVYGYYNAEPDRGRFLASNNLLVPARGLREVGGFDAGFRFSEDRELCDRWLHSGRRLAYVPEAVVLHSHALSFRGFVAQHFGYGRGAFRYHRARARRGSGRLSAELAFYRTLLGSAAGRLRRLDGDRAVVGGLLAVWQAANAAGYAWEAASSLVRR